MEIFHDSLATYSEYKLFFLNISTYSGNAYSDSSHYFNTLTLSHIQLFLPLRLVLSASK